MRERAREINKEKIFVFTGRTRRGNGRGNGRRNGATMAAKVRRSAWRANGREHLQSGTSVNRYSGHHTR